MEESKDYTIYFEMAFLLILFLLALRFVFFIYNKLYDIIILMIKVSIALILACTVYYFIVDQLDKAGITGETYGPSPLRRLAIIVVNIVNGIAKLLRSMSETQLVQVFLKSVKEIFHWVSSRVVHHVDEL
jgi:hypothetical protein